MLGTIWTDAPSFVNCWINCPPLGFLPRFLLGAASGASVTEVPVTGVPVTSVNGVSVTSVTSVTSGVPVSITTVVAVVAVVIGFVAVVALRLTTLAQDIG